MRFPTLCTALMDEEHPPYHNAWEGGAPKMAPRDDGSAPHLKPLKAQLGLTQLVDMHSHWFPENVERKIWAYFDRHYWDVTYRGSHQERLELMRKNGVCHFTVLNYAHKSEMSAWLNEWTAEFARDIPEAIPCGTFYPEPDAGQHVRRCIEEYGFRGFKLHLRVGDMDPNDPLMAPAFEQIEAAGLPVIIHCGSAPEPGRYTTPAYLKQLLLRYPRLVVVVAHMGAAEYEAYLTLAKSQTRLYLDTTMVFTGFLALNSYPPKLLERLEKISGQVLFGSDFPTIPYPISHAVEGILNLPFTDQARRAILVENADRLIGLNGHAA